MRVLMLGWEFPPHISGGLGTACYGMTRGLSEIGVQVVFVLPTAIPLGTSSHVEFRSPTTVVAQATKRIMAGKSDPQLANVELLQVPAVLQAYATPGSFEQAVQKAMVEKTRLEEMGITIPGLANLKPLAVGSPATGGAAGSIVRGGAGAHYEGDLMSQVYRYARLAVEIARSESFDVIHAHDWMTYPAGLAAAAATRKPLVVHVHSTEFDRSGENINQQVYDIERTGMHGADRVVCVSHLTKNIVLARYGVPAHKVEVVYNAVEIPGNGNGNGAFQPIRQNEKIVLFLGRVTLQKGPEYFIMAAKKVVDKFENVRFIVAGSGDMITRMIQLAADLKIGGHVTFTGFLRGDDVNKIFRMADLYVMPSVSEPFGIAPLEALSHNVPVIISKQSGVSEVLSHVLKVDFWDTDEMANKILAVLRHPPLQKTLRQHGQIELRKLSWRDSAVRLEEIYEKAASRQ